MKRLLLLLLVVAACGGCRSTYNITLYNGMVITAKGKPKYDEAKGTLYYTAADGKKDGISMAAVKNFQPRSWKSKYDGGAIQYLQ